MPSGSVLRHLRCPIARENKTTEDTKNAEIVHFCHNRSDGIFFVMSATEVIKELEELPSQEREKVLRWLQQQGLKDLWARADALMKDAAKLNEDEILRLPRVRQFCS